MERNFLLILSGFLVLGFSSCGPGRKSVKEHDKTNTGKSAEIQIREKYAPKLGLSPEQIVRTDLYFFIDAWWGVPYKYGGKDRDGIDCSSFTGRLLEDVYKKKISGPSWSLAQQTKSAKQNDLQEGDLVFFKIQGDKISHVGVYLANGYFVHASTSKGVIISNLEEPYYKKTFVSGGKWD